MRKNAKLSFPLALAICGNGVLSTVFYAFDIPLLFAGILTPLVFLFVGVVAFWYRSIFTEIVEALPVNGGAYTCLLNATSKTVAATAGILGILTYIATAVLSADVATSYLATLLPLSQIPAALLLLTVIAVLVLWGMRDSAKIALGIFGVHVLILIVFIGMGLPALLDGSVLAANAAATPPPIGPLGLRTIYKAIALSLLGISSIESSANFVESQAPGVFRKTMTWMAAAVLVLHPLLTLILLGVLPLTSIAANQSFVLATAARVIGGPSLHFVVVVDAILVLSGAILTSFVGVTGLVHRMASDGCLPTLFTRRSTRGTFPFTVWAFLFLAGSVLIISRGELAPLAGVYAVAFVSLLSMTALGNLIMKETRRELKRIYEAPAIISLAALFVTFLGLVGTIRYTPEALTFFEFYFIPAMLAVSVMIYQDYLIRAAIRMTLHIPKLHTYLNRKFRHLIHDTTVVFVRHPGRLHTILHYIHRNETGRNVILVHCRRRTDGTMLMKDYEAIKMLLPHLRYAGVYPHLNVQLVSLPQPYGPGAIAAVTRKFHVPRNRILVGSIHHTHQFDYDELGGVRIIF